MLTVSEKMKVAMKRKNITMQQLADKLGVTRQNVYTKFQKNNFSEDDLRRYCEVLGIEYEVFLIIDGEKI